MVGADENSAKDCGIVVDTMTQLLTSTPGGRGVILGVHHAGKDAKTLRGSSALESGVDTVYSTSRDETLIELTREKRKDGPEHDHHLLKVDPITGTKSAVMSIYREGVQTDRGAALLSIFVQNFEATGASKSELRTVAMGAGMPNMTFYRALDDLLKTGKLTNDGTVKRPYLHALTVRLACLGIRTKYAHLGVGTATSIAHLCPLRAMLSDLGVSHLAHPCPHSSHGKWAKRTQF